MQMFRLERLPVSLRGTSQVRLLAGWLMQESGDGLSDALVVSGEPDGSKNLAVNPAVFLAMMRQAARFA